MFLTLKLFIIHVRIGAIYLFYTAYAFLNLLLVFLRLTVNTYISWNVSKKKFYEAQDFNLQVSGHCTCMYK